MTPDRTITALIAVAVLLFVAAGVLAASLIADHEHSSISLGQ